MTNELINQEWYTELVDECKAIITEAVFTSRWALVEGYWQLGKRIREDKLAQEFAKGNKSFVQDLARNIGTSSRTIYYALQANDKYPEIDKIPEGKNITWNKLITQYLPEPPENKIELVIPKGKYTTIVIDPPWPVAIITRDDRADLQELPYPTMSIEEITRFPINDIAMDNCNLFLWTTHAFLPASFEILKAWGFDYHVCLTWDKGQGYTLYNFYRKTEFVLYAHKGKMVFNKINKNIPTVFAEKGRGHSRKPDIFYQLVKEFTPEPRIDVFSRERRDGFDQWGNETDKF